MPKCNFCIGPRSGVEEGVHSLRSHGSVIRLRLAALALVGQIVMFFGSIVLLAYSYVVDDQQLAMFGVFGLLGALLLILLSWMLAARAHCPLCTMPVMVNKPCAKHGKARTAFGSHRLRVALAILFTNSFNCPYCMESTAVRVRSRRDYQRGRNAGLKR